VNFAPCSLKKHKLVDFRSIQRFQDNWEKQTSLSIAQRDVTSSARLIHFDLSLPALAQWTASPHIAEHRANTQLFASLSKETCEEENYNDLVQVFTQGSPTLVKKRTTLVTGNSCAVTFWEVQHATAPTKRYAYHAMPSGRCSALTVTMPPMQHATPATLFILVGTVP
jgi:hypothetical protein